MLDWSISTDGPNTGGRGLAAEMFRLTVEACPSGLVMIDHDGRMVMVNNVEMVLVNAPVACSDPALRAVNMATDMQESVQKLLAGWRTRNDELGFGVGLAMGPATVGRIGHEGRLHYTAVSAEDCQILLDRIAAYEVHSEVPVVELEPRIMKGFDQPVPVFAAVTGPARQPARRERAGRRPSYF